VVIIFSNDGSTVKTEELWIDCASVRLYGELYIPGSVPAPALLICHGMDVQGFHFLKIYTKLARKACENGVVSLMFDFRGVGRSTGKFDYGFGEQEDVKCALDYLASRSEVLPDKIFVVGHSLGGAVSLYALNGEARVKGLVLWSTPKNHTYNVRKFIKRTRGKLGLYLFQVFSRVDRFFDVSKLFKLEVYGINLRPRHVREKLMRLNECEAVSRLKDKSLLVVIGDTDVIVGVDEAEEVYFSANEPKSLLIIKGADHNYKGKEEELIAKTVDWIKKGMKNEL
jgi:alpha/beta superfamily hydrolase